jgi:hypothetical protein
LVKAISSGRKPVSDHISEEALNKYREKSLSPAEVLSVCDHLESCLICRERLAGMHQLDHLFTSLGAQLNDATQSQTLHLLPEEIADYVDGKLDDADREIADSHLMFCHPCQVDVQDLRAFKTSLNPVSTKDYRPEKRLHFWQTVNLLWRKSAWGMALQTATLAIVVLFLIATLLLRKQVASLSGSLSQLQQKNDALEKQLADIPELQSQIALLQLNQSPLPDDSGDTEALNDKGRQVAIEQGALTGIEALPPEVEQAVKSALVKQQVRKPAMPKELIARGEVLMGGNDRKTFLLFSPKGKITESDRPTLTWGVLEGATAYVVAVYDADANQVAKSSPLTTTHWALPSALKRGVIYSWEVTAIREGEEIIAPTPPAPPAKFKVLEQAKYDELNRAKRAYDSHLVLGTLYAQAGLFDEAEREFKSLVAANPKSILAKRLLRSVQPPRAPKR